MKITLLGVGTCATYLPNTPHRAEPGFLVEFENQKVLFDCSAGIAERLLKIGVNYAELQHIAISHSHPDHYALMHYLQAVFGQGLWGGYKASEINVYAPAFVIENMDTLMGLHFIGLTVNDLMNFTKIIRHTLPDKPVKIGSGELTASKVYHQKGLIDALAFRLEVNGKVFVYSGDTGWCDELIQIAKDADVFVCDSTAVIGDNESAFAHGHLNPKQAGEISKLANVKHLVLTHYYGKDTREAMIEDCKSSGFEGKVTVGEDFQVIEI